MRVASSAVLCVILHSSAAAQTDCPDSATRGSVDDAISAYEEADFETAYMLFDQLILGADLSRSDLVRVYATRALLRFADGDSEGMLRDLSALASVEPEYELGPRAPPLVHDAFDGLRSGASLDLRIDIEPLEVGVRVSAHARGDRADIVRAVLVGAREPGGRFRESTDGTLTVSDATEEVEYYARIVGPGGATLALRGTRETPHAERFEPFSSGPNTLAIALGVTGAVLVAATVVISVLFATRAQETNQVVGPRFEVSGP